MVDHRHPAHHGLLVQLVQRFKVEIAEPFMPTPHFIISARGETKWSSHLEVEGVEAIQTMANLDEMMVALIPNP